MKRSILFAATLAVVGLGMGRDADWCAGYSRQAQDYVRHLLQMKFASCPPPRA